MTTLSLFTQFHYFSRLVTVLMSHVYRRHFLILDLATCKHLRSSKKFTSCDWQLFYPIVYSLMFTMVCRLPTFDVNRYLIGHRVTSHLYFNCPAANILTQATWWQCKTIDSKRKDLSTELGNMERVNGAQVQEMMFDENFQPLAHIRGGGNSTLQA